MFSKELIIFGKLKKMGKIKEKKKTIPNDEKIIAEKNIENTDKIFKIFSQFNKSTNEGIKAKKKILIRNLSQLSTSQSFRTFHHKKRTKYDIKRSRFNRKDNKC
jgi:hypothetical protein